MRNLIRRWLGIVDVPKLSTPLSPELSVEYVQTLYAGLEQLRLEWRTMLDSMHVERKVQGDFIVFTPKWHPLPKDPYPIEIRRKDDGERVVSSFWDFMEEKERK